MRTLVKCLKWLDQHIEFGIGLRKLEAELSLHGGEIRARLLDGHSWLHSPDNHVPGGVANLGDLGVDRNRRIQIDVALGKWK